MKGRVKPLESNTKKKRAPTGAWKCNFPAFMTDQPTNVQPSKQPTEQPTDRPIDGHEGS